MLDEQTIGALAGGQELQMDSGEFLPGRGILLRRSGERQQGPTGGLDPAALSAVVRPASGPIGGGQQTLAEAGKQRRSVGQRHQTILGQLDAILRPVPWRASATPGGS